MGKVAVAEVPGDDARLAAAFEVLAESPDGVARMRELVLSLAVRGELVPQSGQADDAPRVGLGCDPAQRAGSTNSRTKPTAALGFTVPKSWQTLRLEQVACSITDGDHLPPPREEQGVPFLVIGDIFGASVPFHGSRFVSEDYYVRLDQARQPREGDLLYSVAGTIGQVARVPGVGKFCVQRHIAIVRPGDVGDWLLCFLRSPVALSQARLVATGIAQKTVPLSGLRAMAVPMPPLAEQRRIVARVDELMAWIDQFEAARNQREAARIAAREACLATLCAATNPTEVAAAWSTLAARFDSLFTTPEDVASIRQSILQLAVRGRLVPQVSSELPATIEKDDGSEEFSGEELDGRLYPIPLSWRWARVRDVGVVQLGRQRSPEHHRGEYMVPYLRVANVYEARLELTDVKEMNFTPAEQEVFRLRAGDVLLNEGQSYELVGRPALFQGEIAGCCFQNSLLRWRTRGSVSPEFALLVFRSWMRERRFQRHAQQTTNIAHLSAGRLKEIEFPVPPLREQQRILERTETLLRHCDNLELALSRLSSDAGFAAASLASTESGL
jgi:type I restriction enzyme S subunit